jgi:hypothetical protein
MELLQIRHLRPSVVELLSLVSLDDTGKNLLPTPIFLVTQTMMFLAREIISLKIASMAFSPDNPALVGYVELLARLISDGTYTRVIGSAAF